MDMRKARAAAGSAGFFVLAPGAVAGLIPWYLTGWRIREPVAGWVPARAAGVILLAAGTAMLVRQFARFVTEGSGTPAPVAPPEHLVIGGLYRYVRNPMYVAVEAIIVGQALALGQISLLLYAVATWAVFAAWVRWYEEPALARRFGARYQAYRQAVPAWRPRLRPWDPDAPARPGAGRARP